MGTVIAATISRPLLRFRGIPQTYPQALPHLWCDGAARFNGRMTPAIHHTVIVVSDIDASLKFYVEGLGLEVLQDRMVEGDWPALFGAESTSLRVVFLGDPGVADETAGVLELNVFPGGAATRAPVVPPPAGLSMISYFVDVEATLVRLQQLGVSRDIRRVEQATPNGPISLATVRDPDGVTVLLTPGSITRARPTAG
jgi:catechol 2,3-dioxygenase-like lactoylglutathione lyase family enzyme